MHGLTENLRLDHHNWPVNLDESLVGHSLEFKKLKGQTLIFEARLPEEARHPYMTGFLGSLLTLVTVFAIHLTLPSAGTAIASLATIPAAAYHAMQYLVCIRTFRRLSIDLSKGQFIISESRSGIAAVQTSHAPSEVKVIYSHDDEPLGDNSSPTILLDWKNPEMQGEFLNIDYGQERQRFIRWLRDHHVPVKHHPSFGHEDEESEPNATSAS